MELEKENEKAANSRFFKSFSDKRLHRLAGLMGACAPPTAAVYPMPFAPNNRAIIFAVVKL